MNIEEREQGLLKLVEDYRDAECQRLIRTAREEAAELIRRTYQRERSRLHDRVVAERAGARSRVQAARAERETRERAGGERESSRLLALAWPRLEEALMQRWQDPVGRGHWVRGALTHARRLLPAGDWIVRHAPDWPEGERRAAVQEIDSIPGIEADPSIRAGLVVQSAGAVLDASIDGILADRHQLEARLLALLSEEVGS